MGVKNPSAILKRIILGFKFIKKKGGGGGWWGKKFGGGLGGMADKRRVVNEQFSVP